MNKSVVIVGASGHGKVVADIVLKNKDNIVGFLDDNTELAESFAGFPVLGTTDQYQKYSDACFVIAIGNAAVREKLVDKLKNVSWYTAIHPTAVISELDVNIGEGTVVMANAVINAGARIGKQCIINTGAVALIPHVVWNDTDDRIPLTELYKKYKETNRIVLIQDRSAEELKSIIAQCCFFVGARTHATIAAYSSCVPTLVVGYSVKARGIARDIFGTEEEYVIAVQSMKDTFALKRAFEKLWGKKNEIREYLNRTMPQYCEEVLKAKKILETVCESERK